MSTMEALISSQKAHTLSLLSVGLSAKKINKQTGHSQSTVSKLRSHYFPNMEKPIGGHLTSPTLTDIYDMEFVFSALKKLIMLPKSQKPSRTSPTSLFHLKQSGEPSNMRVWKLLWRRKDHFLQRGIGQQGWSLLFTINIGLCMIGKGDMVRWTKIKRLSSDGRKWEWKILEEGLSDRFEYLYIKRWR